MAGIEKSPSSEYLGANRRRLTRNTVEECWSFTYVFEPAYNVLYFTGV